MNTKLNLTIQAFRLNGNPIVTIPGKKVGDVATGKKSSLRLTSEAKTPIKLNAVCILLDKMLVRNDASAFVFDKRVLAEINGVPYLVDEAGVHVEDLQKANQVAVFWSEVLYEVQTSTTVRHLFTDCCREYKAKGQISEAAAAALSDEIFYGIVRRKDPHITVTDDFVSDTADAAFRSGAMKNLLPGITPETSIFLPKKEEKKETAKETPAQKQKKTRDLYDRVKAGEYVIPFEWQGEAEKHIVPLSYLDGYIPNDTFWKVLRKVTFRYGKVMDRIGKKEGKLTSADLEGLDSAELLGNDSVELTMSGSPGTGKTSLMTAIAAATGLPLRISPLNHNTEEDFAEGKTKIVAGKPQSVPTAVLNGVQYGGIVVLEEVNLAQPAVTMGALGQCVEYPYILLKDGYEQIRRHPLCMFASTMNVGTAGSKSVSEPFSNRFKASYDLEDAKKQEFIKMLVKRSGITKYICTWVYEVYETITKSLESPSMGAADTESILLSLSLRSCIGALQNLEEGSDPKTAVEDSIIGKIAERDWEAAEKMRQVLESYRDLMIEGGVYEEVS